jgi:hypothetical protein
MKGTLILKFSKKKARNKLIELLFYVLIMVLMSIFLSKGDIYRGAFAFTIGFIIIALPQFILHFNYLNHDKGKKIKFDYQNNSYQEFKNGKLTSEIKISDIKLISHSIGTVGFNYRKLPHMDYNYYKICTKNEVFVFSYFTKNFELEFQSNEKQTFSFFNLINLKNDYAIKQAKIIKESNDIEYYSDSRVLKLIEQYEPKTNKELNYIIENKKSFQVEAVKAAQFILKGRL